MAITDQTINELFARNLINEWLRDIALTAVLGLRGERKIARAKCARIAKQNGVK